MTNTLYEINKQLASVLASASELDDSEVLELGLRKVWESLQGERQHKIDQYCAAYKSIIALADSIKEESKRLRERAESKYKQAEHLLGFLRYNMTEREAFENERHKITWRKSYAIELTGTPVPNEFLVEKEPSISLKAIGDAMKAQGVDRFEFAKKVERLNFGIK